jgi:hypothetical protein
MTTQVETNVFPILNLDELKGKARMYRIRGLSADQDEYHENRQAIINGLRFMKTPVTIVERKGEPLLVLREDSPEPPLHLELIRTTAHFERMDETIDLDYRHRNSENEAICINHLRFTLNGLLYSNPALWEPASGRPFFEREPLTCENGVNVFQGFSVRVVPSGGALGFCVDVAHRYVSSKPLPTSITKTELRRNGYEGARCVYHFGNQWYEIKIHGHSGLSVKDWLIDGQNLRDYVQTRVKGKMPDEVANLSDSAAALVYIPSGGGNYAAPSSLCYPTYDTGHPTVRRIHNRSMMEPHERRMDIHRFVGKYLKNVQLGSTMLRIDNQPILIPRNMLDPPDLGFGNGIILSSRGTPAAIKVSREEYGKKKLNLLMSQSAGSYSTKPLDRQYLILPDSFCGAHGSRFADELTDAVKSICSHDIGYRPQVVSYGDAGAKTYHVQGNAILEKIDSLSLKPGFGIVMIHSTVGRRMGEEDELASMIMRELRERNLFVSVIHSDMSCSYYGDGSPSRHSVEESRYKSYLRNVAISKVLLTNERWPFVLRTPLNADLVIGIDVKESTACFSLFGKSNGDIRTVIRDSNNREKLGEEQVRRILVELFHEEADLGRNPAESIVIHRDGILHASEMNGIRRAVTEHLKGKLISCLRPNVSLNFVEIFKTSPVPYRLFDVTTDGARAPSIQNPFVGTYSITSDEDAWICTTGFPYRMQGTAKPLHVRLLAGTMPFKSVLEDVYSLTCLTWTRPDYCSRYPLSIKLADIRLEENAGEYDEDTLEYGAEEMS